MTAEELLAAMAESLEEDGTYCTIDPETRVITIPPEYQLLGVESDEKAERLYFKCPKIVGNNIDLTKLALRVNFRNAGAVDGQYLVDDVEVDGDDITFSWLLSRRVTQYEGTVSFIVCAVKVSGEEITNEWNTTLAEAEVLEGLEVEVTLPEDETDIVNQLLALAETRLNDVRDATSAANTAASNANQKAQEAENAAEDAQGVIEQITKDSYLHTALQSFIDTVTATPTAYGNAIVKKIEGFIRQETTKGLNLMPLEPRETNATVIITDGGKTYRVTGKNAEGSSAYVWFIIPKDLSELKGRKIYASDYDTVYFGNGSGAVSIFQATSSGVTDGIGGIQPNGFVTVPEQLREDTEFIVVLLFAKSSAPVTTSDGNTFSNLWLSLDEPLETWEPYTGGQPAPNPDYPMEVQGTGTFESSEELQNGIYNSVNGVFNASLNGVCSLHDIPAYPNDEVMLYYPERVDGDALYLYAYKKDGTFISSVKDVSGHSTQLSMTCPAETAFIRYTIQNVSYPIRLNNVRRLYITINGKEMIHVQSEGTNIFNKNGKIAGSSASADVYDETIHIASSAGSGNAPGVFFYLGPITKFLGKRVFVKADKMDSSHASGCRMVIQSVNGGSSIQSYGIYNDAKAGTWMQSAEIPNDIDLSTVTDLCLQLYIGDGATQIPEGETATFENVIVCWKQTDKYHPYQSNVTYIPVDYPLFEGDKIVQWNGEYKLLRKWGMAVFDGDEDPINPVHVDGVGFGCTMAQNVNIDESKKIYSNTFLQIENWNNGSYGVSVLVNFNLGNKQIVFTIPDEILGTSSSTGVDEAKTKIKEFFKNNKTIVCYTLQSPTEEGLTPEAQKALHSIMAADEQTELTIVGVPADAEISNQFLLPRNEDGALNTTAYCTAEKNKIVLNELVAQNLDARVNKLEIDNAALAEQTIVVE